MSNTPNSETRTQYGVLPLNSILAGPRASAVQATSLISAYSVSTAGVIGTAFQAYLAEITATLIAMGAWKGSA